LSVKEWQKKLLYDVVPALLSSTDAALKYFVLRDLLDKPVPPVESVWDSAAPRRILKNQTDNGSWTSKRKGRNVFPIYHLSLVETFKYFRLLVGRYGFNKQNTSLDRAAEYLFSCQSDQGDFRGFIGNQYATYYTGSILASLIDAGYESESRVTRGMQWLLSIRQQDGGWTIPILTYKFDRDTVYRLTSQYAEPVEPDRSKPFSHNWTNMVLQAFASHSTYRKSSEAIAAAGLLKTRFFKPDMYTSYKAAANWTRFRFWWPDIEMALRSLSRMGFSADDPDIRSAVNRLIELQSKDGLWKLEQDRSSIDRELEERRWVSLRICQTLKSLLDKSFISI